MKKIMYILVALFGFIPLIAKAEPVKVYIFEAGGCPACEAQINYLNGLDSLNKKFVIVEKELYIDHNDWEAGADYDLGLAVARAFKRAGFGKAGVKGTPFVVVSDLYASIGYDDELEKAIDEAYEQGDKDIVSCIASGNKDCLPSNFNIKTVIIAVVAIVLVFGAIVVVTLLKENKASKVEEEKDDDNKDSLEEKEEIKTTNKPKNNDKPKAQKTTKKKTNNSSKNKKVSK